MTKVTEKVEEFDLQPDPRVLPMLGEINLSQWRCLGEFIDNSVDSFLAAGRVEKQGEDPEVHTSIPMTDVPTAKVVVRDNGPGMEPDTLEKAMRAGWTGNDPFSSLGLFGMGFNIATARLGTITTVWSTRQNDEEWHGLKIDFDELQRQRHFRTPRLTRPKDDPGEHGTEVTIERLKPEQREWFSRSSNRSKLARELGRSYSAMLRPNGVPISFRLLINGTQVAGRNHCIWGDEGSPSREARTSRYGTVNALQPIDVHLADRLICAACFQWLPASETSCPACNSEDSVVTRQRRVYGWLGIQRYLSNNEYGIDFLRHGRKIEAVNRDLFSWNDGEVNEPEYPIDDPRNRGRIVGEIHLDHCRVTYTKDRFDRNDPAWDEMIRIVRGDGPLRPDKAAEAGYGQNSSPLFLLYQAFRRSTPRPKVAGSYARLLVVPDNDRAESMSKKFHAGEADYQTDAKWWELVEEADMQLLTQTTVAEPVGEGIEGFGEEPEVEVSPEPLPETPPPPRVQIPSLSREYRHDATSIRWDVQAYAVEPTDPELGGTIHPWFLKATPPGVHEFYVNTQHDVFRSATMTPLDGLLAQLAWSAIDFQRGHPSDATFGSVLAELRDRYATTSKLDPIALSHEATLTIMSIAGSLSRNIDPDDSRALFGELAPSEQEDIQQKMVTRSVPNSQKVISDGHFLEFASYKTFLKFFKQHPELFFDGKYWDEAYATLDYGAPAANEEARARIVGYYESLLLDAIWLAEQDPSDLADANRSRVLRASLALELLAPSTETE